MAVSPKIRTARTNRGRCAGCPREIVPGERYSQATRYITEGETATPGLARGRIAINLHEGCPHPAEAIKAQRDAERRASHERTARAAMSAICVNGTVPAPGGRGTCPACGGAGC